MGLIDEQKEERYAFFAKVPLADWTKQERIAFIAWYYGVHGLPYVDKRVFLQVGRRWPGFEITAGDINGGALFRELTDGKRKKPMLERVGTGRFKATEVTFARFRKYEPVLRELFDRWEKAIHEVRARIELEEGKAVQETSDV